MLANLALHSKTSVCGLRAVHQRTHDSVQTGATTWECEGRKGEEAVAARHDLARRVRHGEGTFPLTSPALRRSLVDRLSEVREGSSTLTTNWRSTSPLKTRRRHGASAMSVTVAARRHLFRRALCSTRTQSTTPSTNPRSPLHTHTHTHIYIYIYIYVCVCVCVYAFVSLNNSTIAAII